MKFEQSQHDYPVRLMACRKMPDGVATRQGGEDAMATNTEVRCLARARGVKYNGF